jgi:hypothetical protein
MECAKQLFQIVMPNFRSVVLSSWFNVLRNDGISESAWDEDNFSPPELLLTNCHTPVLKSRTEASIRVPRMLKSHV